MHQAFIYHNKNQGHIFNTNANLSIQICQFHGMVNPGLSKYVQTLVGFNLNSKRLWCLCHRNTAFSRHSRIWLVSSYLHTIHSVWQGGRGALWVGHPLLPFALFLKTTGHGSAVLQASFPGAAYSHGNLLGFCDLFLPDDSVFLFSETKVIED